MRSLTFWISMPFMIGIFVVVFMLHIIVWIASAFLAGTSVYFDFTQGCMLSMVHTVIAVGFIALYLAAECIVGLALLTVKDTWYMR